MAEDQYEEIKLLLESHLKTAQDLCERCDKQSHIKGVHKLLKKCKAELKFLQSLSQKRDLKASHVKSSNLTHLQGIMEAIETLPDVVQVLQPFTCPSLEFPLVVDVVCNQGYNWVKIVARNAQALHLRWAGDGQFGERNIVEQAEEYVECCKHHLHHYRQPQIVFIFTAGVTRPLQQALQEIGVLVHGSQVDVGDDVRRQLTDLNEVVRCPADCCVNGCCDCGANEDGVNVTCQNYPDQNKGDKTLSASPDECPCHNELYKKDAPYASDTNTDKVLPEDNIDNGQNVAVNQNEQLDYQLNPVIDKLSDEAGGLSAKHCDNNPKSFCSKPPSASKTPAATAAPENIVTNLQLSCQPDIKKVNLDITTLISLVSNACHGRCNFIFQEDILSEQAAQERQSPLLPKLNAFFKDKELYACKTAIDDFKTILDTIGGKQECNRAEELMQKITILEDQPSTRALSLQTSAKIKERARIIFGTGDTLQAITVSANVGFIRAAKNQGVSFAVFVHEPRVLTEQKEKTAKPFVA